MLRGRTVGPTSRAWYRLPMGRGRASYASWEGRSPAPSTPDIDDDWDIDSSRQRPSAPLGDGASLVARGDGVWFHDTNTDSAGSDAPASVPGRNDALLVERDQRIDALEAELKRARDEIEELRSARAVDRLGDPSPNAHASFDDSDELTRPRSISPQPFPAVAPVPPASSSEPTRVAPRRAGSRSVLPHVKALAIGTLGPAPRPPRPDVPVFSHGGTMLMAPSAVLAAALEEESSETGSMTLPESSPGAPVLDVVPRLPPIPVAPPVAPPPLPPVRSREFDLPSFAEQSSSGGRWPKGGAASDLPLPPTAIPRWDEPAGSDIDDAHPIIGPVSLPPPSSWVPPEPAPKSHAGIVLLGLVALLAVVTAALGYAYVGHAGPFAHRSATTPGDAASPVTARPTGPAVDLAATTSSASVPTSASPASSSTSVVSSSAVVVQSASVPAVDASALPSAPSVDISKLLSFQAYLVVHSSASADVVVQGVQVGRTNEPLLVRCGPKNVRLRTTAAWITDGQHVHIDCMQLTQVDISPATP